MNIVVFGPPGVGKGTASEILSKKLHIPKISTGDVLREEMDNETEIGKKVKEIVNSGNLVPDEMIIEIFKERISAPAFTRGFITDGFPRTVKQAEALDKIGKIDHVFNMIATHDSLLERLTGRRLCTNCGSSFNVNISLFTPKKENVCDKCGADLEARKDQEPKVVENRLKVYDSQTKPVLDYYKKKKILYDIDAEGTPEEIVNQIQEIL